MEMDTNNSFELHTWMLARFIETSDSDVIPLSYYVIAVSYEKMITRMNYRVSTSYRDAITNLPQNIELPERYPPGLNDASNSKDNRFITLLMKYNASGCLTLSTPIDKLVEHKEDLYNQETYVDFHLILGELLEIFLDSLLRLKDYHELRKKAPSSSSVNLDETIAKIEFIAMVGTLLRLLVKSQAIKKCLYTIAMFLPDRGAVVKAAVDNKTDDDDDDDERDEDDDDELDRDEEDELYADVEGSEDDSELKRYGEYDAVEHGSRTSIKSQSCLKSLNLVVVFFDAILVLQQFVAKQRKESIDVNINIKVLLLPKSQEESMLPWKTLIQHKSYFPGKPEPTPKEIIEFLELRASSTGNQRSSQNTTDNEKSNKNGQKSSKKDQKSSKKNRHEPAEVSPETVTAKLVMLHGEIDKLNSADSIREIVGTVVSSVVSSMNMLQYELPGSAKYTKGIVDKLQSLASGIYKEKGDLKTEIKVIMGKLRTLGLNAKLERMLREGSPLDTGLGFKGSVHAEACVAAYCTKHHWFSDVSYFIIMCCSDLLILLVVCSFATSRCI